MDKSQVYAKHFKAGISPKKVAPIMDLVRGSMIHQAKRILAFEPSKAARLVLKVLDSAHANAVNNNKLDENKLFISEIYVAPGPMTKSGQFVGRGRFSPILKRSSHIYVGLSEISKKGDK